ncbi:hypothetical protein Bca101_024743 [Brassica carinata]
MQPINQVEIDEALAASLLYDDPESTIFDEVTARQIQQREEDMENHVSPTDDVNQITNQFQDMEVNRSISLHCGSSSHQQSHVEGSIDTSSHSSQSPPSGDIDPDNMTYEELNELGESIGAVNKGLAKSRIDQIPTHKFGETSWFRKKVSSSSGETE